MGASGLTWGVLPVPAHASARSLKGPSFPRGWWEDVARGIPPDPSWGGAPQSCAPPCPHCPSAGRGWGAPHLGRAATPPLTDGHGRVKGLHVRGTETPPSAREGIHPHSACLALACCGGPSPLWAGVNALVYSLPLPWATLLSASGGRRWWETTAVFLSAPLPSPWEALAGVRSWSRDLKVSGEPRGPAMLFGEDRFTLGIPGSRQRLALPPEACAFLG